MRENDTLTWIITDHLGSTTALANEDGTLKTLLRYTAFGEIRKAYGSDQATDYRYTGQRSEGAIGLYFYVSRFYDPALGRFIQPDSIIPDPGSSKAYDRYAYVNNNPVNFNDPSGHSLACADGDESDECGYGSDSNQIRRAFLDSGNYGGLFAEYYAARAYANDSYYHYKHNDGPKGDNYYVSGWNDHLVQEQTVANAFSYAVTYVPQDGFDATSLMDPALIYGVASATVSIAKDGIGSGVVPSPNGRKGGTAHQQAVSDIFQYLKNEYGEDRVITEYEFKTPGGAKGSRFADVTLVDESMKAIEVYQIGLMTNEGVPIARERAAINDILIFGGYTGTLGFLNYR